MLQHFQAIRAVWTAPAGKEEELWRAWDRVGDEERRLQEREAQATGAADREAGALASTQGTPRGREAEAVEELQRAPAEVRRRVGRVERAERDSEPQQERAQEGQGTESCHPLQLFRQPGIPPEQEVQERAPRRITGEAARLEKKGRVVAEHECRIRGQEAPAARKGTRVIPDLEGDTPPDEKGGTGADSDDSDSDDSESRAGSRSGERRVQQEGRG